ncbi:MAG: JAB domain-containing protein [Pseudomonadota bacterium]
MTTLTFDDFAANRFETNGRDAATVGSDDSAAVRVLGTLLSYAGVSGDAGEMAARLLGRFGSLGAVLRATPGDLKRDLPTAAVAVMKATLAVHRATLRERLPERVRIDSPDALMDFLADELRYRKDEAVLGLFLDADLRLVAVEVLAVGTVDRCPLTVREVVGRCMEHQAAAMIMAHNHPSGRLSPSDIDEVMTRKLQSTLAALDIDLLEHVIVGDGVYSIMQQQVLR